MRDCKRCVMVAVVLLILAGCGGGGGGGSTSGSGPNTVNINITSPATSSTTYNGSATNLDPQIIGAEASGITTVALQSGYTGTTYTKIFQLSVNGTTAGDYSILTGNGNGIVYVGNDINNTDLYTTASGTITMTQVGASVGAPITGTFSVIFHCLYSCTSSTLGMNGSFNVIRSQ